jgi:hypothetical protein
VERGKDAIQARGRWSTSRATDAEELEPQPAVVVRRSATVAGEERAASERGAEVGNFYSGPFVLPYGGLGIG